MRPVQLQAVLDREFLSAREGHHTPVMLWGSARRGKIPDHCPGRDPSCGADDRYTLVANGTVRFARYPLQNRQSRRMGGARDAPSKMHDAANKKPSKYQ